MNISVLRGLTSAEKLRTIINLLKGWDWDAVMDNVSYTDSDGVTRIGTVFYPDTKRKVALAVQDPDGGGNLAHGVDFCTVSGSTVIGTSYITVMVADGALRFMQNNSAITISVYTETAEDVPENIPATFFVAKTVSQETGVEGVDVIGKYSHIASDGYYILSSDDAAPVTTSYEISAEAPYTTLLPLVGSNAGVPSGIYYPLMTEGVVKDIKIMHINDKTFYKCGKAVMIDYFVG